MDRNTFTTTASSNLTGIIAGELLIVGMSGDVEDFTWQVQYSLDGGVTFKPYKDAAAASTITGSDVREFRAISSHARITVTSMGTATTIASRGGKAEG
jgi:hypothetical protein